MSLILLCACGICGKEISPKDSRGRPHKYISGHNRKGIHSFQHGMWKGGRYKTVRGYINIKCWEHARHDIDGYVYEHRLVMEKHLGRYLTPTEEIHHINGVKDDNRIENLMLFSTKSEHIKHHRKMTKL